MDGSFLFILGKRYFSGPNGPVTNQYPEYVLGTGLGT
jgi:hypothetical protein